MATVIVPMIEADDYTRESYGITHKSAWVYRAVGPKLHNPGSPHRIKVWDNTGRPNTDPGRYNKYSGTPGPGRYLDPHRKGTDAEVSVTTSAEATVISAHGDNTGTPQSGQVYAPDEIRVGDYVILRYPYGTLSVPYVVTERWLADPDLIPVAEAKNA